MSTAAAPKKNVKFLTPVFRVSFPSMFEATPGPDGQGEKKFRITMLFDKTAQKDPKYKAIVAEMKKAVKEKFGGKVSFDKPPSGFKIALREGSEKGHMDGYGDGVMFASATSKTRPGLVDGKMQPIIDPSDFYPGCYARATITVYGYEKGGGRSVAFGLLNVQKVKDGESFSIRGAAENDFEEVEDWEEEKDGDDETSSDDLE